jgi:F0F1-type ATP synthase membrane subunit c/vacuolar-type H+-ATPase subunit K
VALIPNRWAVFWRDARNIRGEVSISTIVVGINGLLVASLLWAACLYFGGRGWSRRIVRLRRSKAAWFLIGWLAIELGAYFILSPFAAARRMMGIVLTGTLLTGRLLSLTSQSAERRQLVNLAAGFGMALGGLVAWTDYRDAVVERKAVADSIEWIARQPDRRGRVWFTGHWGLHYYAENAGLHPIHPDESVLEAGDWIIYPDTLLRPYGQLVLLEPEWAEKLIVIEWYEAWPLRTNPDYYDGFQPIRHHEGYRMRVTIFRVKKKFLAQPV